MARHGDIIPDAQSDTRTAAGNERCTHLLASRRSLLLCLCACRRSGLAAVGQPRRLRALSLQLTLRLGQSLPRRIGVGVRDILAALAICTV
jgi:hypothetical protein